MTDGRTVCREAYRETVYREAYSREEYREGIPGMQRRVRACRGGSGHEEEGPDAKRRVQTLRDGSRR